MFLLFCLASVYFPEEVNQPNHKKNIKKEIVIMPWILNTVYLKKHKINNQNKIRNRTAKKWNYVI